MLHENHHRLLSAEEKRALLHIAKSAIEWAVKGGDKPRFDYEFAVFGEARGAFVTISERGQLRGCIGFVLAIKPLAETVFEMAVAAAQRDPRFPPVAEDELARLEIELSVLSPLRTITDISEIQVGVHGLYIKSNMHSGLLLPQVAEKYGWSREQFLEQTCIKAGLPQAAWRDDNVQIEIFSAQVFGEGDV